MWPSDWLPQQPGSLSNPAIRPAVWTALGHHFGHDISVLADGAAGLWSDLIVLAWPALPLQRPAVSPAPIESGLADSYGPLTAVPVGPVRAL